jgi:hypothetical protein
MALKFKDKALPLTLFFICFLWINTFVTYYISQEHYIYFWDSANYWGKYKTLSELFKNSPLTALKTLLHSIRYDDYNLLPVFFLTPFNLLFGDGRLAYILSIANIFALPSILLIGFLLKQITSLSHSKQYAVYYLPIFSAALFPQLWTPVLQGEVGISGVVIINVIFLVYSKKPIEKQSLFNLFFVGGFLCALVLLRRWYSYWVVSFFIALIAERFITMAKQRFAIKDCIPAVRNIFIMGMTFVIAFFFIATPFAKRILSTNYADIYSAYKGTSSILQVLVRMYDYFGLLTLALLLLGVISALFKKERIFFIVFLIAQFIITVLLFSQTQDFCPHHYYLLIPTIIIFISLAAINIYRTLNKKFLKTIFLLGYFFILLLNFAIVFMPKASDYFNKIDFLFPREKYYPLTRNDIGELHKVLDVMQRLVKNDAEEIYVLSSSFTFNEDILRGTCSLDKHFSICKNILPAYHVDKRDGFPRQFLNARYVIVAEPIQYHLRPEDQRIVGILAEQILYQSGIGLSYKKLPYEFTLDNSVKVSIYDKNKPFKQIDLENLSNLFITYYPDKRDNFKITVEDNKR